MRMWMVNPKIMCRKHLLGEHVELHMFIGTLQKGISVTGYLNDNLMEPESMYSRHDELVAEMESRGYNHKSPLPVIPVTLQRKVNNQASLKELLRRCPECSTRYERIQNETEIN